MHLLLRVFALSFLVMIFAGCTGVSREVVSPVTPFPVLLTGSPVPTPQLVTPSPAPAPLAKSTISSCPVTLPNNKSPDMGGDDDFNLGNENGTLFTVPWPEGTVIFARDGPGFILPDGSLEMKWPWYRTIPGNVIITGHRLDAPAPPMPTIILRGPPDGYGATGFHPSGLSFPSEGCWEVTAKVGEASLTFVTLVVKVPFAFIYPNWFPEGLVSQRRDTSDLPGSLRDIYDFSTGGELIFESSQGPEDNFSAYPATAQQKVIVNGYAGTCVHGMFDEKQQWQDRADAGALEWTADGSSYRISHKGMGLGCNDLLNMARASP